MKLRYRMPWRTAKNWFNDIRTERNKDDDTEKNTMAVCTALLLHVCVSSIWSQATVMTTAEQKSARLKFIKMMYLILLWTLFMKIRTLTLICPSAAMIAMTMNSRVVILLGMTHFCWESLSMLESVILELFIFDDRRLIAGDNCTNKVLGFFKI